MRLLPRPPAGWLIVFGATIFLSGSMRSGPVAAEQWTDVRGDKTISATLLGLWGDAAVLELPTGRRVVVPMAGLQGPSRIQARKRSEQITAVRDRRIGELRRAAEMDTAAAPDPLPTYDPPPLVDEYPSGGSLQAAIDWSEKVLRTGRLMPLFSALSAADQKRLIDKAAGWAGQRDAPEVGAVDVDSPEVDAVVSALHDAAAAIVEKQNWFLSHPRLREIDEDQKQLLKDVVIAGARALYELTDPRSLDWQSLRDGRLVEVLQRLDDTVAPPMYHVMTRVGVEMPTATARQEDGQHWAVYESMGIETAEPWVNRDGVWMPERTATLIAGSGEKGSGEKGSGEKGSGDIDPAPVAGVAALPFSLSSIAESIRGTTAPLINAQTRQEYHEAMEQLIVRGQSMAGIMDGLIGGVAGGGRPGN